MKNLEISINANGNSYDVYQIEANIYYNQNMAEMFKEHFNTNLEPTVRFLKKVQIDDIEYNLFDVFADSGSEDYLYFATTY